MNVKTTVVFLVGLTTYANGDSLDDAVQRLTGTASPAYIHVIGYEQGTQSTSDNYPNLVQQNIFPKGTTLYPIRYHFLTAPLSFLHLDVLFYQDSFGTWKYYPVNATPNSPAVWLGQPFSMFGQSETEQDAIKTEDQRVQLMAYWKSKGPFLSSPKVPYPPQALQAKLNAEVKVTIVVENGKITDVTGSGPEVFARATERWVKNNWIPNPTTNETFRTTVNFRMEH